MRRLPWLQTWKTVLGLAGLVLIGAISGSNTSKMAASDLRDSHLGFVNINNGWEIRPDTNEVAINSRYQKAEEAGATWTRWVFK